MTQKPDATRIAGITPAHDKETRTRLPANGAGFFMPKGAEMNPCRIPGFILRGIILAAADNWQLVTELADTRRRLKAMR